MIRTKAISFWFSAVCLFFCESIFAQQPCCKPQDEITLCYFSAAEYCFSNASDCHGYSLDGKFMRTALKAKLENPDNFSPDGISPFNLSLKKLENIQNAQSINDCGCDIVFMPSVSLIPGQNRLNQDSTFLPLAVLESVREWSLQCSENLAIISQGEITAWGYNVENSNNNPNLPEPGNPFNSIFDGLFGTVASFNQGGVYKGVLKSLPTTGAEILARNRRGQPTLAYDLATNDIIVGDIGIFCFEQGDVTEGGEIDSDNDIFVCNFFDLACRLATGTVFTSQEIEICDNIPVVLPSGEMEDAFGIYIDTLPRKFNDCDSIVTTELVDCVEVTVPNIFSPNNDGTNDFFNLIGAGKVIITEFKVFNRWGQMVYNNETPETGWNGNFDGKQAPSDVYIFKISYRKPHSSKKEQRVGDVTLYR